MKGRNGIDQGIRFIDEGSIQFPPATADKSAGVDIERDLDAPPQDVLDLQHLQEEPSPHINNPHIPLNRAEELSRLLKGNASNAEARHDGYCGHHRDVLRVPGRAAVLPPNPFPTLPTAARPLAQDLELAQDL